MRPRRLCRSTVVTLLSLAAMGLGSAQAQSSSSPPPATHIFTCKDPAGHTLTSDQPIPECANRPMEEKSRQGILIREIPAPLTAEQRRQLEIQQRRQKEEEEAAREREHHDRALLATYSSEQQIEAARQRALADFTDALAVSQRHLADLKQEEIANQREADRYKGATLPVPLQHRIDVNEAAINTEQHLVVDRKNAIDRINQRFDADLQRFRELTAGATRE